MITKRSPKEVPKSEENVQKKFGLVQVLEKLKAGLYPAQISKKYNIPKQTLTYSLDKLKELGCIKKVGYGVWEVLKEVPKVPIRPKGTLKVKVRTSIKEIRGHAFIWKIEFISPYDWMDAIKKYRRKKLSFSAICRGKVARTIFNNRKIWLTKKGLVIYEPLDFLGRSSFEVKGTAVFEMDRLIKGLMKELNLKIKQYRFTTSREHFAMVKNELARQYNDKKEKMMIRGDDGTIWLWIDHSKGEHELETGDPNISRQVQNYWNINKKHSFKINADYILKNFKQSADQIKKNAEHLEFHAENMRSHVGAIKELGEGVNRLTKMLERMEKRK